MAKNNDPMKQMRDRFAAGMAIETALAAAAPYIEKGVAQAKEKATEVGANIMGRLPVDKITKLVMTAPEAKAEAQQLAASLQSSFGKIAATVQDEAAKLLGNSKLTDFAKDVKDVVDSLREEFQAPAAPVAEEAAPEASVEETPAPAAEEAPAAPKKVRKTRKPRGPKL